jgi:hypothetical protein
MSEQHGWAYFEQAAPEVAAQARAVIDRWGFMFAATIRRDGTPRISPVETHLVAGNLALAVIPQSRKASDLARDPRIVLQSPIVDADEPGAEVKLRGRAGVLSDGDLRQRIVDAIESASGWRPGHTWLVVTVSVDKLAVMGWRAGDLTLTCWDPLNGTRGPDSRHLDITQGGYVAK